MKNNNADCSIIEAGDAYLKSIRLARSENTVKTYKNGLNIFFQVLKKKKIDPEKTPAADLDEDSIAMLIPELHHYAATSERLYLTAVTGFLEYLSAENLAEINPARIQLLLQQRARKPGIRLPQFPKNAIEQVLDYADTLGGKPVENEEERLRNLRDCAFLITLADTGLRIHEACNLRRGDIDWFEGQAVIIGKGNKQAVVRFSRRSQAAMKNYLQARSKLDGKTGRPLGVLPVFARHDKGAGEKILPVTTTTGRNIVNERVKEALGPDMVGKITPHSFRHYFVTRILQVSDNLKLAQELARHQSITVTQRYAHLSNRELDAGYWKVFEENRKKNEEE